MSELRNLAIVLGDQLDLDLSALDAFDPARDAVWMAENQTEATHVWCHKKRLVLFFAAMRHHRDAPRGRGFTVHYHALQADARHCSGRDFAEILTADINRQRPQRLVRTECGDHRAQTMLGACAEQHGLTLQVRPDRHFYCSIDAFNEWADNRKACCLKGSIATCGANTRC